MRIPRYSLLSPWKKGLSSETFQPRKRLPLVLLCIICGLFLRVPAAATLQGLYVGAEAPDFSLADLKGQKLSFEEIKGEKLTMIIFWSTWSRNSEKVLTRAQQLFSAYKEKGLAIVAVNADSMEITPAERAAIAAMVENLDLEYPVLLDNGLTVFHDYGVIALPSTVILDPDRTIRYELSGYPLVGSEEMDDFIIAQIEGREPKAVVQRKGYQPDKKALRFYNMGTNALRSKRMTATAELWFKKAAEADPLFVQPHISLGRFYAARDQLAPAKEQFDLALQKEPQNVVALCELGLLLVDGDKLEEGKTLMQKALQVEESYTPCFYYLGYTYGKEGKMEEALPMFERALEINRMDMDIFVFKGRMYEERGKPEEASKAYRQALELLLSRESGP
jgi:tetratricopeptide (TPR) repeat protein